MEEKLGVKIIVDGVQPAVTGFKNVATATKVWTNDVQTLSQTISQLGTKTTTLTQSLDKEGNVLKTVRKETEKFNASVKKAAVDVDALNKKVMATYANQVKSMTKVTGATENYENGVLRSTKTTGRLNGKMVEVSKTLNSQTGLWKTNTKQVENFNRGLFKTGDSFGKIILKVAQWTLATGAIFGTMRALKGGITTIVDIDDKMVMLNKVFQGTQEQLAMVRSEAFRLSVQMGNLSGASIEASTEWAKLGRVGSELSEGLRVSLLGQNIAEIDAADGAKLLNAAMIQFNKAMDEGIGILDEWNELSNRTPATTRDLAASVQQAGAIFNSAGASIQDLNAYTAALSASMAKSGKEIGSALKTIGSYIRRQSSLPKILDAAGISIERQGGQLMDLDDIVLQLSGRWGSLTDVQKEEIAQTAAGVRRKAFFLNLMDNFNLVLENYAIQWEAAGSAVRENEIRMDSLKTKMLQFTATVEKLAIKTGDKGLLGAMKGSVDYAREAVDSFGDLTGAMQLGGIAVGAFGVQLARSTGAVVAATKIFSGLGLALGGATASFAGLLSGIGVMIAVGLAIDKLISLITAEERALRSLNAERKKRVDGLRTEAGLLRASIQQYELFKSLVASLDGAKGADRDVIMGQISQVWDAINEVNPALLSGATSIEEALARIGKNAEGAKGKLDDLLVTARKEEIKISVSTLLEESKFKDELDKFIKDSRIEVVDYASGPGFDPGFEYKMVDNPFYEMAENGDAEKAIQLLKDFKATLAFSDMSDKEFKDTHKGINDLISQMEAMTKKATTMEDALGDVLKPEFDSGAWEAMKKEIAGVSKEADALDERLRNILNGDRTSAELFADIGIKGGREFFDKLNEEKTASIKDAISGYDEILKHQEMEPEKSPATAAITAEIEKQNALIEDQQKLVSSLANQYNAAAVTASKINTKFDDAIKNEKELTDSLEMVKRIKAAGIAFVTDEEVTDLEGKLAKARKLVLAYNEDFKLADDKKLSSKTELDSSEGSLNALKSSYGKMYAQLQDEEDAYAYKRNKGIETTIKLRDKLVESLNDADLGTVGGLGDNSESIRAAVDTYKEFIDQQQESINLLEAKASPNDDDTDVLKEKKDVLEETKGIYELLLESLIKLTAEEKKLATETERTEKAAARKLETEKRALAVAEAETKRKTDRGIEESRKATQDRIDSLSSGLGDVLGSQLGDAVSRAVGGGLKDDYVWNAMRSMSNDLGALLAESVSRRTSAALHGQVADIAALAVGGIAGAGVGAIVGILADSLFGQETPAEKLADELDKNTLALQENTNAFQDFQERLINAPSTFSLPSLAGDSTSGYNGGGGATVDFVSPGIGMGGGGSTVSNTIDSLTIQISGSGSPAETGKAVVAALDKIYQNNDNRGKNLTQDF